MKEFSWAYGIVTGTGREFLGCSNEWKIPFSPVFSTIARVRNWSKCHPVRHVDKSLLQAATEII